MKVTQAILAFGLSLILFSCHNDDDGKLDFSSSSLKQTQWKGSFIRENGGDGGKSVETMGIVFYSESKGVYSIEGLKYDFGYSIDGKVLIITGTGGDLEGYWLLIQSDKNKMVLTNGTGEENTGKATLNLTRNY